MSHPNFNPFSTFYGGVEWRHTQSW